MGWRASIVVSTYNAPRELDLVLTGLRRQSVTPVEILIADDGSDRPTSQLLDSWPDAGGAPVRHVRQDDRGFRKARIVNEAVARAQGDYVAFLDGDIVPHRHWLRDHLEAARARRVLCGRRVRLGPDVTARVTRSWVEDGLLEQWFGEVARSGDARNFGRGIRLPAPLALLLRLRGRKLMGCNFSLPRAAFEAVNGYDEDFEGFGGEDFDLDHRLRRAGFRLTPLLNRGCAYHLYHPVKRMSEEMRRFREEKTAEKRVRCERGLDGHA